MTNFIIRELKKEDNPFIEQVIRSCLIEYGANHEGTAWADPCLSKLSEVYNSDGCKYWVAEDKENNIVVAGCGIGKLDGKDDTCELQKLYCLKEYRRLGIGKKLIETALLYAKKYYKSCYLETLENMNEAINLYEKYGFERIKEAITDTGHFNCDVRYILHF